MLKALLAFSRALVTADIAGIPVGLESGGRQSCCWGVHLIGSPAAAAAWIVGFTPLHIKSVESDINLASLILIFVSFHVLRVCLAQGYQEVRQEMAAVTLTGQKFNKAVLM